MRSRVSVLGKFVKFICRFYDYDMVTTIVLLNCEGDDSSDYFVIVISLFSMKKNWMLKNWL